MNLRNQTSNRYTSTLSKRKHPSFAKCVVKSIQYSRRGFTRLLWRTTGTIYLALSCDTTGTVWQQPAKMAARCGHYQVKPRSERTGGCHREPIHSHCESDILYRSIVGSWHVNGRALEKMEQSAEFSETSWILEIFTSSLTELTETVSQEPFLKMDWNSGTNLPYSLLFTIYNTHLPAYAVYHDRDFMIYFLKTVLEGSSTNTLQFCLKSSLWSPYLKSANFPWTIKCCQSAVHATVFHRVLRAMFSMFPTFTTIDGTSLVWRPP